MTIYIYLKDKSRISAFLFGFLCLYLWITLHLFVDHIAFVYGSHCICFCFYRLLCRGSIRKSVKNNNIDLPVANQTSPHTSRPVGPLLPREAVVSHCSFYFEGFKLNGFVFMCTIFQLSNKQ